MLLIASALKGYAIEATDGVLGTVSDFLFDDGSWKIRWLVVDTGGWLPGRKVLLHPSALDEVNHLTETVAVRLTRTQVQHSPDITRDEPVSRQMEYDTYHYYGWDPLWGGGAYGMGMIASPLMMPPQTSEAEREVEQLVQDRLEGDDPQLRSMHAVKGYHIEATDGGIGHVQDFIIDEPSWSLRYLIIDTSNWWFGQHVLISPYAVTDIDWSDSKVRLNVTREQIKSSPAWDPATIVNTQYEQLLHSHYAWPGYGW